MTTFLKISLPVSFFLIIPSPNIKLIYNCTKFMGLLLADVANTEKINQHRRDIVIFRAKLAHNNVILLSKLFGDAR